MSVAGAAPAHGTPGVVTVELADAAATLALGAALAPRLAAGDVVALYGELGSGKTTLVRGLLRRLGHRGEVPSPTFTLVQHYPCAEVTVWHFDLYRIAAAEEVVELGWDDARADGVVVVEWPERLGPLLPADRLEVVLEYAAGATRRRARLRGCGRWQARLGGLADAL